MRELLKRQGAVFDMDATCARDTEVVVLPKAALDALPPRGYAALLKTHRLYSALFRVYGAGLGLCGNQNIQDTFNFIESEWICKQNLSKLRDLDQRGTVVQKSAESTSI